MRYTFLLSSRIYVFKNVYFLNPTRIKLVEQCFTLVRNFLLWIITLSGLRWACLFVYKIGKRNIAPGVRVVRTRHWGASSISPPVRILVSSWRNGNHLFISLLPLPPDSKSLPAKAILRKNVNCYIVGHTSSPVAMGFWGGSETSFQCCVWICFPVWSLWGC